MRTVHGRWKIQVDDNVVMQNFSEAWNEEAVITYIKQFKKAVAPLLGSEWAMVSVFEQWELGVPEIEHHVAEFCEWFKKNGCVKDCHVYSANTLKNTQLEKMIPHTEEGYERCVFDNVDDAISWLHSEGFPIRQPQFLYDLERVFTR